MSIFIVITESSDINELIWFFKMIFNFFRRYFYFKKSYDLYSLLSYDIEF